MPAAGSRPDRLSAVSEPKERVQRHIVEQMGDCVPVVPLLDVPDPDHAGPGLQGGRVGGLLCPLFPPLAVALGGAGGEGGGGVGGKSGRQGAAVAGGGREAPHVAGTRCPRLAR